MNKLNDEYKSKINLLVSAFGSERVKLDEQLKFHTFSKLGGPAEAFYIATSQKELINILDTAHDLKIPYFVLGNGTKVMISDKGMSGLVIKNRTSVIKLYGIKGKVGRNGLGIEEALLEVDSGVSLLKLNQFLKDQNLMEFEGFSSVNATFGGALFIDPNLQAIAGKIKVWEHGAIYDIEPADIRRNEHIILSGVIKVKAHEV